MVAVRISKQFCIALATKACQRQLNNCENVKTNICSGYKSVPTLDKAYKTKFIILIEKSGIFYFTWFILSLTSLFLSDETYYFHWISFFCIAYLNSYKYNWGVVIVFQTIFIRETRNFPVASQK